MDFETAVDIWRQIRASVLTDARQDLVELAMRYARKRVDYYLADPQQQSLLGADRTRCHNALIASFAVLARKMAKGGEDDHWRLQLGNDRKEIGDFACMLHAILGIAAR